MQEALIAAATTWPADGRPDNPLGWLIRVASRRLANVYRSDDARRRREELAASWSVASPDPPSGPRRHADPHVHVLPPVAHARRWPSR